MNAFGFDSPQRERRGDGKEDEEGKKKKRGEPGMSNARSDDDVLLI